MQLDVTLQEYPGVEVSINFEIEIVGCEITELSIDPPA